jgi:hypothetical protein
MKPILLAAVMLVLLEAILLIRLRHENWALRQEQARVEQVRLDLARALEAANVYEAEVRSLKSDVARLQDDLEHTNSTAVLAALPSPQILPPSEERTSPQSWGLTTNEVDLSGMLVVGNSNSGALFVPLVGEALGKVRQGSTNRQTVVFGKVIHTGHFPVWSRDGTNVGRAFNYGSRGEAEAVAAQIRLLGSE